jgi:hypothetical protein
LGLVRGEHPSDETLQLWDPPVWFMVALGLALIYLHDLRLGDQGGLGP